MTPVRLGIVCGALRSFVVPSPSSPDVFPPQASTVPSDRRAKAWREPTEIWTTSLTPATWVGVATGVGAAGMPSSPRSFAPHAHTVPSDRRARLKLPWAATATMPEGVAHGRGTLLDA